MYPTLSFLNRECTQEYKIPDTNLTVPKGTPVLISLLGVMRDPDNFPNPSKFWPDRYSDEDPHYNPDAYIPFGEGPRACIGRYKVMDDEIKFSKCFFPVNELFSLKLTENFSIKYLTSFHLTSTLAVCFLMEFILSKTFTIAMLTFRSHIHT